MTTTTSHKPYTTTAREFFQGVVPRVLQEGGAAAGLRGIVEFDLGGQDGGRYLVDFDQRAVLTGPSSTKGSSRKPTCIVRAQARDFMALVEGRMSPQDGLLTERLHVTGDAVSATYDAGVLTNRVAGAHAGTTGQRIAVTTGAPTEAVSDEAQAESGEQPAA